MNFRFEMKRATALSMMLTAGSVLVAQVTTGGMSGAVRDHKGNPVVGVQVTLTSSALFNPRVIVTDAKGEWRAPLLPPGSYVVQAVKPGFVGVPTKDVRVGLGASVRQDLIIKPLEVAQATVEVVAAGGATVDKADSKVATNFSNETLQVLPTANRSFTGAADLTPGVVFGANGQATIRGGSSNSALYRVNGVDIKDDLQGSQTGTGAIEDLIEDVQVIVSPLNARFGRTASGAINVVTKTGGNDFAGSIRASIFRSSWNSKDTDARALDYANTNDDIQRSYDVVLTGPIWKDHVWFSLGTILMPKSTVARTMPLFGNPAQYNRTYRTGNAGIDAITLAGPAGYTFTAFDTGLPYVRQDENTYYEGKFTGAITPDHTVELSFRRDKNTINNRDPYSGGGAMANFGSLGKQSSDQKDIGFGYRGVITSKVFLEARYNRSKSDIQFPVSSDTAHPDTVLFRIYDINSAGLFGFSIPNPNYEEVRGNRSGNVNLKLFVDAQGEHEMDLGIDFYQGEWGTATKQGANNRIFRAGGAYVNPAGDYLFPTIVYPGPGNFGQSGSGLTGVAPTLYQYYGEDGLAKTKMKSAYINDAWTIDQHWNLMLGVRANKITIVDTTGIDLASSSNFEPRFELKYDPTGASKYVFSTSLARLYSDFVTGFTRAFMTQATSAATRSGWAGIAGQPAAGTATDPTLGVRFVDYATLTNPANYAPAYYFENTTKKYEVDPNLKAPYADEFTVGFNRMYENGSKFRVTYVYRRWKQEWALSADYMRDQMVTVTDPSPAGLAPVMIGKTKIFNSNELQREYNAVEMEWKNNINQAWSWGGTATYSRLTGNNTGGDTPGDSYRDNSVQGYYGNRRWQVYAGRPEAWYAPSGLLSSNETFKARAWVALLQPIGKGKISYSAIFNYDMGGNWSAANTAPMGLAAITTGTPYRVVEPTPLSYTRFYSRRGAYSWNDTNSVDFKVNWEVPIYRRIAAIGSLQVNNVFNHILQATWDNTFYSPAGGTGALYVQDSTTFGRGQEHENLGNFVGARNFALTLGLRF